MKRVIFVLAALLLFPTVIHAQEGGARSGVRVVMENGEATNSQLVQLAAAGMAFRIAGQACPTGFHEFL